MSCIYIFILLVNLITALRGELSLKIFEDDKFGMPEVYDEIEGHAGTNLTLICKLVDDSGFRIHFDNELYWGKRKKDVHFENIEDLKNLAENTLILHRLRGASKDNQALLQFLPLVPSDEGIYFCMSLKYKLFKIAKLNVKSDKETDDFAKYLKAVDKPPLHMLKSLSFPRFSCTDDLFTCKSGSTCINYEYVCDGIKDCMDGSDESVYMCGIDPCEGKRHCHNQRCISELLCCDKSKDPGCIIAVRPSCCDEGDSSFEHNFDWPPPVKPPRLDNTELFNFPDFSWPSHPAKPSYDDDESHVADSSDVEVHDIWVKNNSTKTKDLAIIVVPCVLVTILVIVCIIVRRAITRSTPSNRYRRRRSQNQLPTPASSGETTPPSAGVLHTSNIISTTPGNLNGGCGLSNCNVNPPYNPNFDLPPSYDEVMANSSPSAPPINS
ncbi:hypothetical protein ILUMI_09828 [Ignelater luminosus]|uniref:Ig-like domain-containing protein n=1 Tax=Ignelater luminosus TaxID=2038154 RepID=A0A8K0D8D6_IGNLU|nr:hypothetical protein ILUMI_09828 [Ignelater luminosus]